MKRRKPKIALSRSKLYSCSSKLNSIMRNISNKSKPIRKRRSDIYRSFPIVTSKSISLTLILKRSPTKISNSANRSKLKNWFFSKVIRPSKEFINKRSNCKSSLRRHKGKKTNSQRKKRFSKNWSHKTKLFCRIICLSIRAFVQVQERSANPTKKSHFRKAEKERDLSPEKAPSQKPSNLKKRCI